MLSEAALARPVVSAQAPPNPAPLPLGAIQALPAVEAPAHGGQAEGYQCNQKDNRFHCNPPSLAWHARQLLGDFAEPALAGGQYNPALTGGGSIGYNQQFAYDPRQYNPALTGGQYNPALTGGGSIGYNQQFINDPQQPQYDPRLTGGGSAGYNAQLMQFAYDPDYVQYKLKKAFEDNWISPSTK